MKKTKRQLVLNKGREKFIFRYESGCEDELLDVLVKQVKERKTSFDWFDAAVLSFKLTQALLRRADELLNKGPYFCGQADEHKKENILGDPSMDAEFKTI